jgi:hypothetical protein
MAQRRRLDERDRLRHYRTGLGKEDRQSRAGSQGRAGETLTPDENAGGDYLGVFDPPSFSPSPIHLVSDFNAQRSASSISDTHSPASITLHHLAARTGERHERPRAGSAL